MAEHDSRSACQLYACTVDLTGSTAGPMFTSVRLLMDGSEHRPERLRELTAEHYGIPLEQVGPMLPITREQYAAEEEAYGEGGLAP